MVTRSSRQKKVPFVITNPIGSPQKQGIPRNADERHETRSNIVLTFWGLPQLVSGSNISLENCVIEGGFAFETHFYSKLSLHSGA